MRTRKSVIIATKKRHVCLRVSATQNVALETGSRALLECDGPTRDSLTACHVKMASANMSNDASQTWLLSAAERVRKFGRPNSDWEKKSQRYSSRLESTHRRYASAQRTWRQYRDDYTEDNED